MSEERNGSLDGWMDERKKEHGQSETIGMELESVVLTQMEFTLLASIEGLEHFCGMEIEPSLPENQEEMWELVAKMIQKGELIVREAAETETGSETVAATESETVSEAESEVESEAESETESETESIEAVPYLRSAFQILRECEQMTVLYPGSDDCASTCIYPSRSGRILMIQNSNINEKELRLSLVSREELWNSVWDRFNEMGVTLSEEEDSLDMEIQPFDEIDQNAEQLYQRDDVFLVVDKINTNSGAIEGRCLLIEEEVLPWLLIREQGTQKKVHPSRQAVRKFLESKV
ncbi:MAG: hypothetical protein LUI13_15780 [Lachnospiraceae bacterium]|nr:hypothetical protein [Lachnospiraceae bacterium]